MRSVNLQPPSSVCQVWGALGISLAIVLGPSRGIENALAHEFEDGHVERSVSFVVRDRKVFVEYAVGCNTNTMTELLNQWQADQPATTAASLQQSPAHAGANPAKESSEPHETADAETTEVNPAAADDDADVPGTSKLPAAESRPPDEPGSSRRPMTEQEIKIESTFQSAVLAEIAKQLEITCNGERPGLRPVSVELSPRHHVNALARLEFDLPTARKIRLTVQDVLFPTNAGGVRYALKPKGSAILLNSNVAPILVRAQRVDLTGLSPEIRAQQARIDCELSFTDARNETDQANQ